MGGIFIDLPSGQEAAQLELQRHNGGRVRRGALSVQLRRESKAGEDQDTVAHPISSTAFRILVLHA